MYKEGLRDKYLQDYEKIKIEGEYKNGKRHGEWREYGYDYGEVDEKKILLNKDIWKNNEIVVQNGNGRWAKCFENQDSIECEGNYKNGQLDGGYIEYHEEDLLDAYQDDELDEQYDDLDIDKADLNIDDDEINEILERFPQYKNNNFPIFFLKNFYRLKVYFIRHFFTLFYIIT